MTGRPGLADAGARAAAYHRPVRHQRPVASRACSSAARGAVTAAPAAARAVIALVGARSSSPRAMQPNAACASSPPPQVRARPPAGPGRDFRSLAWSLPPLPPVCCPRPSPGWRYDRAHDRAPAPGMGRAPRGNEPSTGQRPALRARYNRASGQEPAPHGPAGQDSRRRPRPARAWPDQSPAQSVSAAQPSAPDFHGSPTQGDDDRSPAGHGS
jgi:hypothetical protein